MTLHVSVLMSSSLWLSKPSYFSGWCHSTAGWASPHQRNQQDPRQVHRHHDQPAASTGTMLRTGSLQTKTGSSKAQWRVPTGQPSLDEAEDSDTKEQLFLHSSRLLEAKQPGTYPRHMSLEAKQRLNMDLRIQRRSFAKRAHLRKGTPTEEKCRNRKPLLKSSFSIAPTPDISFFFFP